MPLIDPTFGLAGVVAALEKRVKALEEQRPQAKSSEEYHAADHPAPSHCFELPPSQFEDVKSSAITALPVRSYTVRNGDIVQFEKGDLNGDIDRTARPFIRRVKRAIRNGSVTKPGWSVIQVEKL